MSVINSNIKTIAFPHSTIHTTISYHQVMLYGREVLVESIIKAVSCLNSSVSDPGLALCASCPVTVLYLDPRPSVIFGSSPGIDQALLVEACKVRVPLLQAEQSTVGGRGCYLLVGDYAALHAQWSRAF